MSLNPKVILISPENSALKSFQITAMTKNPVFVS